MTLPPDIMEKMARAKVASTWASYQLEHRAVQANIEEQWAYELPGIVAALRALTDAGYWVAPMKPTEGMCRAGADEIPSGFAEPQNGMEVYKAMRDAFIKGSDK